MKAYLLFEQSGTFKNEFIKLGIPAEDYDILNDFNQTDHQIDLFEEIKQGYKGYKSVFDNIKKEDITIAFFPCVRFECQMIMNYKGVASQMQKWSNEKKLENNIKSIHELAYFNEMLGKLCIIYERKQLKLIIENPYNVQNFLNRYWIYKAKIIDLDRTRNGDYFTKPTQYWFINCEPKMNYVNEKLEKVEKKTIVETHNKVERSLIHSQYARRFIKKYILEDYTDKGNDFIGKQKTIYDY